MRLCEHPDFEQAIIRAEEFFRDRGLRPAIIEKDYYVTEVLRIIAHVAGNAVIFKGGTSLSKGWNLVQRFSEDIDLFLDPLSFDPPLGRNGIDRQLRRLRVEVDRHPGLTFVREDSRTIGGFGRSDQFLYSQRFGGAGEIAGRVVLEAGTASGREPTVERPLRSYLSEYLELSGYSLGAEDEASFTMRLLHFRRTFVEKLFAIHGKVELLKRHDRPLGSYARHYYDIYQLAGEEDVRVMLQSSEYDAIKADYHQISRTHFPRDYLPPEGMSFAMSDALFPSATLADVLARNYREQCASLCFGAYPDWNEIQARLEALRQWL